MPNLSGFFRACRRLTSELRSYLTLFAVATGLSAQAQPADYLRTALAHFNPNVPAGWAYTLQTRRNDLEMTERFDPSRTAGSPWSLRQFQGRPPTSDELVNYAQSRPTSGAGGMQANFQREDIEPGSLKLLHEDEARAEYAAAFREQASGPDKMLGHLRLTLTVNKAQAYVERYTLQLTEPYWPVLGVKMQDLRVEASFSAPEDGRPALLRSQQSLFSGRFLLFFSKQETLSLIYSEFSLIH